MELFIDFPKRSANLDLMDEKEQLRKQVEHLQGEIKVRYQKINETIRYLNGNPDKAILLDYYEGGYESEGGFPFGHVYDFVYIGSHVFTKYGNVWTIKSYDAVTDMISFEETDTKLGTSRISQILSKEDYEAYQKSEYHPADD